MADHILIVEDDKALSHGIALALQSEKNVFTRCETLEKAREVLQKEIFKLVILDLNLPDGNGLDLLEDIKKSGNIAVICLTANDMETDIVTGFEMGADDYITKPFSLMILRARVNNQLKKNRVEKNEAITIDHFSFDFEYMDFMKKGQHIELSKTEQKLLKLLVMNRGQTMSRERLIDSIWTDGADYVDENALSVTIKRLRAKLEDEPSKPQYIRTIYGIGYVWGGK